MTYFTTPPEDIKKGDTFVVSPKSNARVFTALSDAEQDPFGRGNYVAVKVEAPLYSITIDRLTRVAIIRDEN